MAFIQLSIDMDRCASALERIAAALEFYLPKAPDDLPSPSEGAFFEVTQADHYQRERDEEDERGD